MLATLSPEAQVARILDDVGCVPSNFSEIADRHANSRVIQALKGANDFEPEDGQYYLQVARQMKKLAEEYPVPIDWRKTQTIKEILAARRTQARPVPFVVILVGGQLFKKVSNQQIQTANNYQECAAFKDKMVAMAAAKILENVTNESLRVTTITNERRPAETIHDRLVDYGFPNQ
jgi:uncharacterized protein YerC